MMTFLADFLAKLFEPLIEKIAASLFEKLKELETEKEINRIDQAVKTSQDAKTSEDVKKAAHEASEVTRNL